MNEDQAKLLERLVAAVEGLTLAFQRAATPVVIVTKDENCELVHDFRRRGHPVYFQ